MLPAINSDVGGTLTPENVKQIFQRMAKPEEIATLIGYLLSDESKFTTGTAIPIDGGCTA
jgi:NAD(P)-dependent dehydrogenase (short-subunit alcohol dehydrogenase family)